MAEQTTVEGYEFNDPPFNGEDVVEIEKEMGVKLQILGLKDIRIQAYPFKVSGSDEAVARFLSKYLN